MEGPRSHDLVEVAIADDPHTWAAAGFATSDDSVVIGTTRIRLIGTSAPRGIRSAAVRGVSGAIDGMPFVADDVPSLPIAPAHANRVTSIDHVVALSPDMDRTTDALVAAGFEARRSRRFEAGEATRRQTFFWLGDTILELAGDDADHGAGPATLWGLAFTCDDLDAAAEVLGDRLGSTKPAVQAGRRIATLRTRDLDISIPVALMSSHPGHTGGTP
jgi:hypothetical protein